MFFSFSLFFLLSSPFLTILSSLFSSSHPTLPVCCPSYIILSSHSCPLQTFPLSPNCLSLHMRSPFPSLCSCWGQIYMSTSTERKPPSDTPFLLTLNGGCVLEEVAFSRSYSGFCFMYNFILLLPHANPSPFPELWDSPNHHILRLRTWGFVTEWES
jgi:hypothetical protein